MAISSISRWLEKILLITSNSLTRPEEFSDFLLPTYATLYSKNIPRFTCEYFFIFYWMQIMQTFDVEEIEENED